MGNVPAKVYVQDNKTVINKNDLDVLNKSITNRISNSQISQAAECGSHVSQEQNIVFEGVVSEGPITVGDLNQYQNSSIDFSCTSSQNSRNNISNDLYNNILNSLKSSNSNQILSELNIQANKNIQGGAVFGSNESNSDINNNINWNHQNDQYQYIQKVIEESIQNNFTTTNLNTCNNNLIQSEQATVTRVHPDGEVYLGGITQQQANNNYTQCMQNQNVANDITDVMLNVFGVGVTTSNVVNEEEHYENNNGNNGNNNGNNSDINNHQNDYLLYLSCCICCIIILIVCILAIYLIFKKH